MSKKKENKGFMRLLYLVVFACMMLFNFLMFGIISIAIYEAGVFFNFFAWVFLIGFIINIIVYADILIRG